MKKKNNEIYKSELDCPLRKHTPKSFGLAVLLGIFIGLAVIVPGVSGSTVAIIFGMYTAMLYALGNIFADFRRCFSYLLPIGIGAVVGFLGGFLIIQRVFEPYMFELVCLFGGLMIGAIPAITAETKGEKKSAVRLLLLGVGFVIPLLVSGVSILLSSGEAASSAQGFGEIPVYLYLLYIPLGAVVSATQVIPGLSATAILMACGQFGPILGSLHLDYIIQNPEFIALMICLVGGFAVGIVLISKGFSKLIEKRRAATFFFVTGLSFGSIASMFFNSDMWELYTSQPSGLSTTSVIIGAALLVLGFVCSFLLTRYELGRTKKK